MLLSNAWASLLLGSGYTRIICSPLNPADSYKDHAIHCQLLLAGEHRDRIQAHHQWNREAKYCSGQGHRLAETLHVWLCIMLKMWFSDSPTMSEMRTHPEKAVGLAGI